MISVIENSTRMLVWATDFEELRVSKAINVDGERLFS